MHGEVLDCELPLLKTCHGLTLSIGELLLDLFDRTAQISLCLRGSIGSQVTLLTLHNLGDKKSVSLYQLLLFSFVGAAPFNLLW